MRRERRGPAFTKPIPTPPDSSGISGSPDKSGVGETKQEIKTYLKDLAKELHKPVRHKFPTRKVYVQRKDQTWSMDLADMSTWKRENDGYTYILTLVDVFTRWAEARPLKTKATMEVLDAVRDIVTESKRKPEFFWCDEGKEFVNKTFTDWRENNNIGMYHTYGRGKSVIVERFNRTLKTIMWRRLTEENSHKWVAILPELIDTYNNTEHSVMKMTPNYASAHPKKVEKRWEQLKAKTEAKLGKHRKPKFQIGDVVRISRVKGTFEKGYDVGWTRETFIITHMDEMKRPYVYRIASYTGVESDPVGEEVKGSFYEEEMQHVKNKDVFLVDKVLKERGKGDSKELFVSWLGYPASANSWISAKTAAELT